MPFSRFSRPPYRLGTVRLRSQRLLHGGQPPLHGGADLGSREPPVVRAAEREPDHLVQPLCAPAAKLPRTSPGGSVRCSTVWAAACRSRPSPGSSGSRAADVGSGRGLPRVPVPDPVRVVLRRLPPRVRARHGEGHVLLRPPPGGLARRSRGVQPAKLSSAASTSACPRTSTSAGAS